MSGHVVQVQGLLQPHQGRSQGRQRARRTEKGAGRGGRGGGGSWRRRTEEGGGGRFQRGEVGAEDGRGGGGGRGEDGPGGAGGRGEQGRRCEVRHVRRFNITRRVDPETPTWARGPGRSARGWWSSPSSWRRRRRRRRGVSRRALLALKWRLLFSRSPPVPPTMVGAGRTRRQLFLSRFRRHRPTGGTRGEERKSSSGQSGQSDFGPRGRKRMDSTGGGQEVRREKNIIKTSRTCGRVNRQVQDRLIMPIYAFHNSESVNWCEVRLKNSHYFYFGLLLCPLLGGGA